MSISTDDLHEDQTADQIPAQQEDFNEQHEFSHEGDPLSADESTASTTTEQETYDGAWGEEAEQDTQAGASSDETATDSSGESATPEGMDGNPEAADSYWFEQAEDGWCGPASVSEVVAQATGSTNLEATELEVVARAEQLGFLTHTGSDFTSGWSGMQPADIATLLQSFGVPAAEGQGSMSDLENALNNGDQVIAAVDSTKIWDSEGVEDVADPGQADHALVVTGIDEATGVVYLNDPGRPEGGETQVSLSVFEAAWATSGNSVVVANASGAAGGSDTTDTGDTSTADTSVAPDSTGTAAASPFDDIVSSSGQKSWILPITLSDPSSA